MANKLEVVDDPEDAERANYVVCIKVTYPLKFPDNLVGTCCKCGEGVQFRPYAPKTPPRICWECASPRMASEALTGNMHALVTPKAAKEILKHLEHKKLH